MKVVKVVKIDHCADCPDFFYRDFSKPSYCYREERDLPNTVGIPKWCTRKDANEEEKNV